MLVLGCHSIQLGKYQGQTFRWLLENDAGYACHLVASHQRERETSASDSPFMANKDSLARYSCAHPAFAEHLKFRRGAGGGPGSRHSVRAGGRGACWLRAVQGGHPEGPVRLQ